MKSFSDHTKNAIKIPSAGDNSFIEEQKKNIKLTLADVYIAIKQIDKVLYSCDLDVEIIYIIYIYIYLTFIVNEYSTRL